MSDFNPMSKTTYPRKVLIADDSEIFRKVLVETVQDYDPTLEIVQATNGRELVSSGLEQDYGIILTDYRMPERTGLEAIPEILASRPNANIYLISSSVKEVGEKALDLGARAFIDKNTRGLHQTLINILREYFPKPSTP